MSPSSTSEAPGPLEAITIGIRALREAPPAARLWVALCVALTLAMLPFGRGTLAMIAQPGRAEAGHDAGGFLAPLAVDAGLLHRARPGVDLFAVRGAGERLLRGESPYGTSLARTPYATPYRYPPATALWLGVPLALPPSTVAFVLWTLFGLAQLVANFLLTVGRRPWAMPLLALIWFAWFPLIAEWHLGQTSLLMATLLLWSYALLQGGARSWPVPWLLAILLKVYPAGFALAFWRAGHRRAVIVAAVVVGLLTIPAFVVIGRPGDAMLLEGRFFGTLRQPYAGAQGLQELLGAIEWKARGLSFGDGSAPSAGVLPWLAAAVLVGWGVLVLHGVLAPRRSLLLRLVPLWLLWFIAFRDVWEHHYLLVQPLLALLVTEARMPARVAVPLWGCLGGPSLWWLWQRSGYAGSTPAEALGLLYFLQRPVGVIVLAAWAWLVGGRCASEGADARSPGTSPCADGGSHA